MPKKKKAVRRAEKAYKALKKLDPKSVVREGEMKLKQKKGSRKRG